MKQVVTSPDAPKPVGPYSQAIQAGSTLYISGQLAINPKDNKLIEADITAQTRQVMQNIQAILAAANFSLKDIVQTTVYLSSMTHFSDFNKEYAKYFPEAPPARQTVACELKAGALVEVSAVACKIGSSRSFDKL
ncbi:MAG: Rid family detoxifying hydrolase [Candidatus Bathyarchaeota archaeon]|nr:Rid family detoxifying hydrolase [Candidatus Bathyarchaeota archaeon]